MNAGKGQNRNRRKSSGLVLPGWSLVASRELKDLWLGGRGLIPLILFSVLLGVLSLLFAIDVELSLIPPEQMVFMTLQITIAVGLFIGLLIGADSVSGERERSTLEGLLLTPTSRREIIFGKYLAAVSTWPVALAVASAYLAVLSPHGAVFTATMIWGALLGSLLVGAFTAFAILVSILSDSNKTSLAMSLFVCLLFVFPTQIPGTAHPGTVRDIIQKVNPIDSANHFIREVVVNNEPLNGMWGSLLAPILFAVLIPGLLFWYASSGVRLESGKAIRIRSRLGGATGILLVTTGVLTALTSSQAIALANAGAGDAQKPLGLSIALTKAEVKKGERFEFTTLVTNNGTARSPSLVLSMNVINLASGKKADPEDWLQERKYYLEPVAPGRSVTQVWKMQAIMKGRYAVYLVAIPFGDTRPMTSSPVTGASAVLTVAPFARLTAQSVLPVAIGMPSGLTLTMLLLHWRRRRQIAAGDSDHRSH